MMKRSRWGKQRNTATYLFLFLIYMSNFYKNYSVFVNNKNLIFLKYNFYLCTIIFLLWHIEFKANIQVNSLVQQSFYIFRKWHMFLHWDEENIEMTRLQDSKAIFFKKNGCSTNRWNLHEEYRTGICCQTEGLSGRWYLRRLRSLS